MSKRQTLSLLGFLVVVFLFLGLPSRGEQIVAVIIGLLIIFISYTLPTPISATRAETFEENRKQ